MKQLPYRRIVIFAWNNNSFSDNENKLEEGPIFPKTVFAGTSALPHTRCISYKKIDA